MNRHTRRIAIATVILMLCIQARGQANLPHSTTDLYKNFVGTWVGTAPDFPGSKFPDLPVQLIVTTEKDGKSMRWAYTYSTKGQIGFAQETKFITLDPAKGEMITRWKGDSKDKYTTQSLDQFAKTGFGQFIASKLDKESGLVYRCTFDLEPTSFLYKWETTSNGKDYKVTGSFSFFRETSSNSKNN